MYITRRWKLSSASFASADRRSAVLDVPGPRLSEKWSTQNICLKFQKVVQQRWSGSFCQRYVDSFRGNQTLREFWKSVYIRVSYDQKSERLIFIGTRCKRVLWYVQINTTYLLTYLPNATCLHIQRRYEGDGVRQKSQLSRWTTHHSYCYHHQVLQRLRLNSTGTL